VRSLQLLSESPPGQEEPQAGSKTTIATVWETGFQLNWGESIVELAPPASRPRQRLSLSHHLKAQEETKELQPQDQDKGPGRDQMSKTNNKSQ